MRETSNIVTTTFIRNSNHSEIISQGFHHFIPVKHRPKNFFAIIGRTFENSSFCFVPTFFDSKIGFWNPNTYVFLAKFIFDVLKRYSIFCLFRFQVLWNDQPQQGHSD